MQLFNTFGNLGAYSAVIDLDEPTTPVMEPTRSRTRPMLPSERLSPKKCDTDCQLNP